jgi:hypothetical protein
MIKIIEKEVAIKLVVEPEITTLYHAYANQEDVIEIPNARFTDVKLLRGDYIISYLTNEQVLYYVILDKETKEVRDSSNCFYDLEDAKKRHRIKRIEYCKKSIASYQKSLTDVKRMLKHFQSELEKIEKEKSKQ